MMERSRLLHASRVLAEEGMHCMLCCAKVLLDEVAAAVGVSGAVKLVCNPAFVQLAGRLQDCMRTPPQGDVFMFGGLLLLPQCLPQRTSAV